MAAAIAIATMVDHRAWRRPGPGPGPGPGRRRKLRLPAVVAVVVVVVALLLVVAVCTTALPVPGFAPFLLFLVPFPFAPLLLTNVVVVWFSSCPAKAPAPPQNPS